MAITLDNDIAATGPDILPADRGAEKRSILQRIDHAIRVIGEVVLIGGLLLGLRVYVFQVFFFSGMAKLDDFEATVQQFGGTEIGFGEYNVEAYLPIGAHTAALLGTFTEIIAPLFVIVGLYARYAAMPLFVMAIMIQFYLGALPSDFGNPFHLTHEFLWFFALIPIMAMGPGVLSGDWLIRNFQGLKRLAGKTA